MGKIFRHGIVWFLTANLLVSTMGLTVHSLYCLCKDRVAISVFEQNSKCGQPDDEIPSCCKIKFAENHCEKDHDCTKKDKKYIKLATQFTIFKTELELETPDYQPIAGVFISEVNSIVSDVFKNIPLNKPPPKRPYGKTLLPFTQSFLC